MSSNACDGFEPQKFKPNSCRKCFLHRDVHKKIGSDEAKSRTPEMLRKKLEAPSSRERLLSMYEISRREETTSKPVQRTKDQVEHEIAYIKKKLGGSSLNAQQDNSDYKSGTLKRLSLKEEEDFLLARERQYEEEKRLREAEAKKQQEIIQKKLQEKRDEEQKRVQAEARLGQEKEKKYQEEVDERVKAGMPRAVAVGRTTQERQHLSHESARGSWTKVETHYGIAIERWVGCGCGQLKKDTWCSTYTAPVSREDVESFKAQETAESLYQDGVKKRIGQGMPEHIAKGRTLRMRQYLSHTGNDCMGKKSCEKSKKCCKSHYEMDAGTSMWTCCKSLRRDYWCTNYSGPQM